MVVQHNLTAMNANRQLGVTTSSQAKASEKLSSGYKINRAADDAAGLSISEKMRSQIRGLDRASDNAQDGISLIQSAEGALNEAHAILQRMNELAVQGANDTNQSIDRASINQELNALVDELDRISTTTQFNKQNLLDGNFTNKNLQVGANTNQKIAISIQNMNAASLGLTSVAYKTKQTGTAPDKIKYGEYEVSYNKNASLSTNKANAITSFQGKVSAAIKSAAFVNKYDAATGSVYYQHTDGGKRFSTVAECKADAISVAKAEVSDVISNHFQDYVTTKNQTASVELQKNVGRVAVDDYDTANASLSAIQNAINKVSTQRSALGAIQNRLEHTVANLDTVSENTSAAESRIRDTDMAKQMVDYSKNNILAQAGQSMLAQANQINQGVLSLLQ
ncbi:MAG: flagellin [Lachnospiraceae bacterium]|nr:flagellin [Lachnospiraceae bacterium]